MGTGELLLCDRLLTGDGKDWLIFQCDTAGRKSGRKQMSFMDKAIPALSEACTPPLVHGTADDNVYFLHSIRLADALFRSGREFEFLPLAGQTHMVSQPIEVRELYTRIATYFLEQLGGEH